MGVDLDSITGDLKVIERYVRERDREPGAATIAAFQRLALLIPDLVAELVDHRENCARLIPEGGGWFVVCPEPLNHWLKPCREEWPSHDLFTPARMVTHLQESHKLPTHKALSKVAYLTAGGRLPKVSNI